MTAITVNVGETDPFAEVISSLKQSLKSVQPIVTPIQEVEIICTDISTVIDYANDVPVILSTANTTLEIVATICQALIEVPFVDIIAEVAAGIFEDAAAFITEIKTFIDGVIDDVVSPAKKAFNDLSKAIREAVTVVSTISSTIPDYLNTVEILSYCLDITQTILPVLADTEASDSTEKFIEAMVTVRDDVSIVISPLSEFIEDIAGVITAIQNALGSSYDEIKQVLQKVKKGLGSFEVILDPIKSAFSAVENAIAPIKWVLDAVESIIKKVLEPVIHAVLKATGLEALLQPLLDQIEEALGVKPLFNILQANINAESSEQWQSQGGTAAVSQGSSAWAGLVSTLKQYNTRDKDNTYQLIVIMVAAITNSPSGEPPFPIPDWPNPPQPGDTSSSETLLIAGVATAFNPQFLGQKFAAEVTRTRRAANLKLGFANMQEMSATVATTSTNFMAAEVESQPLWVTDNLTDAQIIKQSYDDVGLPNVTKLLEAAKQAKESLQDAQTIGPNLANKLALFDSSRQLPSYFKEEMEDFAALFNDGVKLIDFLLGFDWIPEIFQEIESAFKQQADEASNAYGQTQELLKYTQEVDRTIALVESTIPNKQSFTQALQYIDQIAAGAASLGNTVRRGLALDIKLDGQFASRILEIQNQIDTDAAAALEQMNQVHDLVADSMEQATSINNYLTDYGDKFTVLGRDSQIISTDGLPKLSKGVQICNTIASILDPLSGILQDLNCQASKNPENSVIKTAGTAVDDFKSNMKNVVENQNDDLKQAFDFVLNKAVPSGKIYADIQDINNLITQRRSSLNAISQKLEENFNTLTIVMKPQKSFQYQTTVEFKANPPAKIENGKTVGGGETVTKEINQTVSNFFVDGDFKTKVINLITEMIDAANKS